MELNEYVVFKGNFKEALEEAQKREVRLASLAETINIIHSGRTDLLRTGMFLGTGTIAAYSGTSQRLSKIDTGNIKIGDFSDCFDNDALLIDPSSYRAKIEGENIILSHFAKQGNRNLKYSVSWKNLSFGNLNFLNKNFPNVEPVLNRKEHGRVGYVGPVITGGFDVDHAITAFPPMGTYTYFLVPPSLEESLQESAINEGLNLITLNCTKQKYDDAMHNARLYVKNFLGKSDTKTAFETLVEVLDAQKPIVAEGHVIIKSALPFDPFNRCVTEAVRSTSGKGDMLYEEFFRILLRASQQLPPSRK